MSRSAIKSSYLYQDMCDVVEEFESLIDKLEYIASCDNTNTELFEEYAQRVKEIKLDVNKTNDNLRKYIWG